MIRTTASIAVVLLCIVQWVDTSVVRLKYASPSDEVTPKVNTKLCYECAWSPTKLVIVTFKKARSTEGRKRSYRQKGRRNEHVASKRMAIRVQGGWDKCYKSFNIDEAIDYGISRMECEHNCYTRVDKNGNLYRGCFKQEYDVDPQKLGCHHQAGSIYCFCEDELCNNINPPEYGLSKVKTSLFHFTNRARPGAVQEDRTRSSHPEQKKLVGLGSLEHTQGNREQGRLEVQRRGMYTADHTRASESNLPETGTDDSDDLLDRDLQSQEDSNDQEDQPRTGYKGDKPLDAKTLSPKEYNSRPRPRHTDRNQEEPSNMYSSDKHKNENWRGERKRIRQLKYDREVGDSKCHHDYDEGHTYHVRSDRRTNRQNVPHRYNYDTDARPVTNMEEEHHKKHNHHTVFHEGSGYRKEHEGHLDQDGRHDGDVPNGDQISSHKSDNSSSRHQYHRTLSKVHTDSVGETRIREYVPLSLGYHSRRRFRRPRGHSLGPVGDKDIDQNDTETEAHSDLSKEHRHRVDTTGESVPSLGYRSRRKFRRPTGRSPDSVDVKHIDLYDKETEAHSDLSKEHSDSIDGTQGKASSLGYRPRRRFRRPRGRSLGPAGGKDIDLYDTKTEVHRNLSKARSDSVDGTPEKGSSLGYRSRRRFRRPQGRSLGPVLHKDIDLYDTKPEPRRDRYPLSKTDTGTREDETHDRKLARYRDIVRDSYHVTHDKDGGFHGSSHHGTRPYDVNPKQQDVFRKDRLNYNLREDGHIDEADETRERATDSVRHNTFTEHQDSDLKSYYDLDTHQRVSVYDGNRYRKKEHDAIKGSQRGSNFGDEKSNSQHYRYDPDGKHHRSNMGKDRFGLKGRQHGNTSNHHNSDSDKREHKVDDNTGQSDHHGSDYLKDRHHEEVAYFKERNYRTASGRTRSRTERLQHGSSNTQMRLTYENTGIARNG